MPHHILHVSGKYLDNSLKKASKIMEIDTNTFYGNSVNKRSGLINGRSPYQSVKRSLYTRDSTSPKKKKNVLDICDNNIEMPALTKFSKSVLKDDENENKYSMLMSPQKCRKQLDNTLKLKKSGYSPSKLKNYSRKPKLGMILKPLTTKPDIKKYGINDSTSFLSTFVNEDNASKNSNDLESFLGKENIVRGTKSLTTDQINDLISEGYSSNDDANVSSSEKTFNNNSSDIVKSPAIGVSRNSMKTVARRLKLDGGEESFSNHNLPLYYDVKKLPDCNENLGDSMRKIRDERETTPDLYGTSDTDLIIDKSRDETPPSKRSFGRSLINSDRDDLRSKPSTVRPWTRGTAAAEESKMLKPYEIGFPNPIGSNRCWMNATLQAILSMEPLVKELNSQTMFSKNRMSSNILEAFLSVVRSRQNGKLVEVNSALGALSKCLGTWDSIFASGNQQDAPEFLVRLLDCFREEFIQSRAQKNVKALNECTLNDLDSDEFSDDDKENKKNMLPNPVSDNVEFQLEEIYTCTNCNETTTHVQNHLALFVDIPDVEDIEFPSMQDAIRQYMSTHTREWKCSKCEHMSCEVTTSIKKLPRFFIVQVKRYAMEDFKVEKVSHALRIPTFLSMENHVTQDVSRPKVLKSIKDIEAKSSESLAEDLTVENQTPVINLDDDDIQEALRQSMQESQLQEELEERNLEEAIKLSLKENLSFMGTPNKDNRDAVDEIISPKTAQNPEFGYRLIAAISHHGGTLNSGHYVAYIYNFQKRKWFHYDDKSVTEQLDTISLNHDLQHDGYVFFYIHRPLYDQLFLES